jgi:hypothetical protein
MAPWLAAESRRASSTKLNGSVAAEGEAPAKGGGDVGELNDIGSFAVTGVMDERQRDDGAEADERKSTRFCQSAWFG